MIKSITYTGISRANTVKMRPHPGATLIDICDYSKPRLCHKPEVIILYYGTNGIENEINRVMKIMKFVKEIDEYDNQNPPKVVISSLFKRYSQHLVMILLILMENFSISVTVKVCLSLTIIT